MLKECCNILASDNRCPLFPGAPPAHHAFYIMNAFPQLLMESSLSAVLTACLSPSFLVFLISSSSPLSRARLDSALARNTALLVTDTAIREHAVRPTEQCAIISQAAPQTSSQVICSISYTIIRTQYRNQTSERLAGQLEEAGGTLIAIVPDRLVLPLTTQRNINLYKFFLS